MLGMTRFVAMILGSAIGALCSWLGNPSFSGVGGGLVVAFVLSPASAGVAAIVSASAVALSPAIADVRQWLFWSGLFATAIATVLLSDPCISLSRATVDGFLLFAPLAIFPSVAFCVVWVVVVELIWAWASQSQGERPE